MALGVQHRDQRRAGAQTLKQQQHRLHRRLRRLQAVVDLPRGLHGRLPRAEGRVIQRHGRLGRTHGPLLVVPALGGGEEEA